MGLVLGVADHFLAETADSLKRRWSPDPCMNMLHDAPAGEGGDDGIISSTSHSSTIAKIKPGSHIYSYRRWGLFSHHGLSRLSCVFPRPLLFLKFMQVRACLSSSGTLLFRLFYSF